MGISHSCPAKCILVLLKIASNAWQFGVFLVWSSISTGWGSSTNFHPKTQLKRFQYSTFFFCYRGLWVCHERLKSSVALLPRVCRGKYIIAFDVYRRYMYLLSIRQTKRNNRVEWSGFNFFFYRALCSSLLAVPFPSSLCPLVTFSSFSPSLSLSFPPLFYFFFSFPLFLFSLPFFSLSLSHFTFCVTFHLRRCFDRTRCLPAAKKHGNNDCVNIEQLSNVCVNWRRWEIRQM